MESGAGGFTDRVEIGDIGCTGEGCFDAPDLIVGGGVYWDRVGFWVDREGVEGGPDAWEAFFEVRDVLAVEPDMFAALEGELLGDGAGDDITRGEFRERMDRRHEAVAGIVEEMCAFSTHGFRDQRAWCAWDVKGGWVELDELHVLECCSGAVRHRDAVTGCDGWV